MSYMPVWRGPDLNRHNQAYETCEKPFSQPRSEFQARQEDEERYIYKICTPFKHSGLNSNINEAIPLHGIPDYSRVLEVCKIISICAWIRKDFRYQSRGRER